MGLSPGWIIAEPSMFDFLRRHQILLSSLASLFFSFSILTAAASGHLDRDPFGLLVLALLRPLQAGAQAAGLWLRKVPQNYALWRDLAAQNERLRQRIVELEAEKNRLLEVEATNQRLRELLDFRARLPAGSLTASILASSASTWFQSIILDRGSSDGVRKGMAVVTPLGVVGQIVSVTPTSSKVLLLADPHSAVDVLVQRSRARGIVSGTVDNGATVKYVKRSEDIREGDRLVTSGADGIFPKGLLVGSVTKVRKNKFGLFQDVTVALAVDPARIEEVFIVSAGEDLKN